MKEKKYTWKSEGQTERVPRKKLYLGQVDDYFKSNPDVQEVVVRSRKLFFSLTREQWHISLERKKRRKEKMSAIIDKYLNKFFSRKLLVWLTATGLMFVSGLDSEIWAQISLVYIGSQSAVDIVKALKTTE